MVGNASPLFGAAPAHASHARPSGGADLRGDTCDSQENVVAERTTESLVTFRRPFALRDIVETQPPGTYQIETVELAIDGLSFVAFRRVSTTITLPAVGSPAMRREFIEIDPADLAAALQNDASSGNSDHAAPALATRRERIG